MFYSIRSAKRLASMASLTIVLLVAACGGATTQLTKIATGAASAPQGSSATQAPAQAGKPTLLANCQAIVQANYRFGMALAPLVNLTTTTDYEALTRTDSPFMVNFSQDRA